MNKVMVVLFLFLALFSQDDQEYEDLLMMSLEDLLNTTVVSSSKIEQRTIEAPNIISLITRDQIKQYGWQSLNDILYKQPGFGPAQDYDRRTVSSRGLFEGWNNNHLLFLQDGIPMNDNLYGSAYTWEITSLLMVKNIEIIRGPGSALYGSNATNGVIQVNTVDAADLKGGHLSLKAGTSGTRTYEYISGHEGRMFDVVMGFMHYETDGNEYSSFDGSGRLDGQGNPLKFTTQDNRSNQFFWTKIKGRDDFSIYTFQYTYQNWNYETGHGWLWQVPDLNESMNESRHLLSFKATPELSEEMSLEFATRYQRHAVDWNWRVYPNGVFEDYYPAGMFEYLNTHADDIFGRAQLTLKMDQKMMFLAGVEADVFLYGGDREHYTDVNLVTFEPYGKPTKLGSWLKPIEDNPLTSLAFYSQWVSGDMLHKDITLTLGARYDMQTFTYRQAGNNYQEKDKEFSKFSPRVALVYMANDDLSFKAMWGQAFRAPTPTEMFGDNTWTLAANIDELKAEEINTSEVGVDWVINKNLNWRTNLFQTEFKNQIAYSTANNNLSTNIYSSTNQGFETELLFGVENISGFTNVSWVTRSDETINDVTITKSSDLTWDPDLKLNFGVSYAEGDIKASLAGHYQGEVKRRATDIGNQELPLGVGVVLDMDKYRGKTVDAWTTFDVKLGYKIMAGTNLGLTITNVLDTDYSLVKNIGFPFDYKQKGRTVKFSVDASF